MNSRCPYHWMSKPSKARDLEKKMREEESMYRKFAEKKGLEAWRTEKSERPRGELQLQVALVAVA